MTATAYRITYNRGQGLLPWSVYRLTARRNKVWLADFSTKEAAESWVKYRKER